MRAPDTHGTPPDPAVRVEDVDLDAQVHELLPLARSIAARIWATSSHILPLDELRSVAYLGLVTAKNRWIPYCTKNSPSPDLLGWYAADRVQFRAFAAQRIRGSIFDELRSQDWKSRTTLTRAKALQAAGSETGVGVAELAKRTGLTPVEVTATLRELTRAPVSLEAEEVEVTDSGGTAEVHAESGMLLQHFTVLVRGLPRDLQLVLALKYFSGLTLRGVAEELGITEAEASQRHTAAVLQVRQGMVDLLCPESGEGLDGWLSGGAQ